MRPGKRKEPHWAASYRGKATSGRSGPGVGADIRSLVVGVATPLLLLERLVLVAQHLAVQLVHHLVDGGVHVFIGLFDEDVAALDVKRHLSLLPPLFLLEPLDGKEDTDVHHLVEMPRDAV